MTKYLKNGNYFSNIHDIENLYEISKHLKFETYSKDSVIFKENSSGLCYYIILAGKVIGYKEKDYKEKHLFTLSTGQSFGEMALLSNSVRMCSIKAAEHVDLIVITK